MIGASLTGDVQHFVVAGQLEIQFHRDRFTQNPQIAVLNVPAIFTQVKRDAVGAAKLRERGGPNRVGLIGAPRLPHGRHVVDVDAEFCHEFVVETK